MTYGCAITKAGATYVRMSDDEKAKRKAAARRSTNKAAVVEEEYEEPVQRRVRSSRTKADARKIYRMLRTDARRKPIRYTVNDLIERLKFLYMSRPKSVKAIQKRDDDIDQLEQQIKRIEAQMAEEPESVRKNEPAAAKPKGMTPRQKWREEHATALKLREEVPGRIRKF